jgi:hypothetical protein
MWPDREWKHAAAAAAAAADDDDDEGVGALPTWPVRTNNSVAVAAPTWRGENVLVVYGTNTCSSCAVLCCAVLCCPLTWHGAAYWHGTLSCLCCSVAPPPPPHHLPAPGRPPHMHMHMHACIRWCTSPLS